MAISLDKVFGIHEQALKLRSQRTEILANNLANVDTPNFKARDIDFSSALKKAMSGQKPMTLHKTHQSHISGMGQGGLGDDLKYRVPNQPALDGNTVEAHVEKVEFTKSAVEYQATLKFLESRSVGMIKAIKGEA